MNFKNCKRCKKLFQDEENILCDICIKEEEKDIAKVQEYLEENEGATLIQVSTELEIGIRRIERYLREGRIDMVNTNSKLLNCEKCGEGIGGGRYCEKCQGEITGEISKVTRAGTDDEKKEEMKKNPAFKFLKKD